MRELDPKKDTPPMPLRGQAILMVSVVHAYRTWLAACTAFEIFHGLLVTGNFCVEEYFTLYIYFMNEKCELEVTDYLGYWCSKSVMFVVFEIYKQIQAYKLQI